MTERERLIELLIKASQKTEHSVFDMPYTFVGEVADFMIEYGVRLPVTCGECEHSAEQDDGTVFCVEWINYSQKSGWCWLGERRADNGT